MKYRVFACSIRMIFFTLANIFLLGAADFLFAADLQYPGLLESPVPFYHDYNLASQFPVGKSVSGFTEHNGRKRVTLDECIDLALKNNPDHNFSRAAFRATTGDLFMAWGYFTPLLSAQYGLSQSNSSIPIMDSGGNIIRRSGRINKSTSASLNFSYQILNQGQKYFGLKSAYYLRGARQKELQSSELTVINDVRAAYFNVLRQEKLLVAARDQLEHLQKQLRRAEVRLKVGEVTKLDVLQARIDLQNQELLILEYKNLLATAKLDLDLVVGGGLGVDFTLADEFKVTEPHFEVEELIAEDLENHPDLESLRLLIKQQQANLWMGRMAYLPLIKTTVGYSRSEEGLVMTPNINKTRIVTMSMSWNILDAFVRFQTNRYLQLAVDSLKYAYTKTELTVARDIRGSYLELLRQFERHLTLAESETMAEQSLKLETRRYELGTSSMVELRQAQADYSQARADYINSIYDYHEALSTLNRNVGRDLYLE